MNSYKEKYKALLDEIIQGLRDGTVLTTEFREKIKARENQFNGEDENKYPRADHSDLIVD